MPGSDPAFQGSGGTMPPDLSLPQVRGGEAEGTGSGSHLGHPPAGRIGSESYPSLRSPSDKLSNPRATSSGATAKPSRK
jgi:hypothetical protein